VDVFGKTVGLLVEKWTILLKKWTFLVKSGLFFTSGGFQNVKNPLARDGFRGVSEVSRSHSGAMMGTPLFSYKVSRGIATQRAE